MINIKKNQKMIINQGFLVSNIIKLRKFLYL